MTQRTVDIAEMVITDGPGDVLVTYALGSCIGLVLWDPGLHVGGMLHFMLPLSKVNPERAQERPGMFADTGVPLLFEKMYSRGCKKRDLHVKVAGGSKLYDDHGTFEIGKRNYTILRKMLWQNDVVVHGEDIGGNKSRTVKLYVDTGRVVVRSQSEEYEL